MSKDRLRFDRQALVEGLTLDERLARLETRVLGTVQVPGILRDHDDLQRRVEDLESAERRRRLPWVLRWWLKRA